MYPPHRLLGAGLFIYTYAHALKEAGHEVLVTGPGERTREYDDRGVRVHWHAFRKPRSWGWLLDRWYLCRWLDRRARDGQIDVVEGPDNKGLLPFELKDCPVVVRLHCTTTAAERAMGRKARAHLRWSEGRTLLKHRNWIGLSNYSRALSEQTFCSRPLHYCRMPPPVQCPETVAYDRPLPSEYVLFAGSICRLKGALVVGEAMVHLLLEHPDLHLVLAGRDSADGGRSVVGMSRRTLAGSGGATRVVHLGHQERALLMDVMKRAPVLAFPSYSETFGFVTAEAMLQATPVVVAKTGAAPEFVHHERTGLAIAPGDAEALAAAVDRLLRDRHLARQLGLAGHEFVKREFAPGRCVECSVAFYKEVIGRHFWDRTSRPAEDIRETQVSSS